VKVTADDIAQLLASTPPRRVPDHVRQAAHNSRGFVYWFFPLFGLIFGGFGLVFVLMFFPWRFADEWRLSASDFTAPGVVKALEEGNLEINDVAVWRYEFTFTTPEGTSHEGYSYITGSPWVEGDEVTIQYLASNPDVARIEGGRLDQGGWFAVMVLIFPAVGFGMVAIFFRTRRRTDRLLREGAVGEVDLLAVEPTMMDENRLPVFRIKFADPTNSGGGPVTIKRSAPAEVALVTKHLHEKQPLFTLSRCKFYQR
jgi:hypothetical protein